MQHEIQSIECELAEYRKGFLRIRLDLEKGLIVWQDSNHWSNNFVRALTLAERDQIKKLFTLMDEKWAKEAIVETVDEETQNSITRANDKPKRTLACSWQLTLNCNKKSYSLCGENIQDEIWRETAKTIEQISKVAVKIQ